MKRIWLILILLFAVATTAHADDRDKALTAFKEAYRNYEDPSFLFNIAQCERQLDQRADAIRAYRMYLLQAPDATNRDEVRGLIARLEHELAEERATKAAPPPGVEPPTVAASKSEPAAPKVEQSPALTLTAAPPARADKPAYKKWWVWTIVGVAVAGGAAAGVAIALTRDHGTTPTAATSFGTASPF